MKPLADRYGPHNFLSFLVWHPTSCGRVLVHQEASSLARQLISIRDSEFLQESGYMKLHGPDRDIQLGGDFLVCLIADDEIEYLFLPRTEGDRAGIGPSFGQQALRARNESLDEIELCGHKYCEVFGCLPTHEALYGQSPREPFNRAVKVAEGFYTELHARIGSVAEHEKFGAILA